MESWINQMELSEQEWYQVKQWLNSLRVYHSKEHLRIKHLTIDKYFEDKSIKIREFIYSKEQINP